jgi:tetratricopeptide (TPR) repeat protein
VFNQKLLTLATALIFLTACQTAPDKDEHAEKASVQVAEKKQQPKKEDPPTQIDSDVLYLLLTGETALQRKQYDVALEAYLAAAKRVKDPRVAEKAAQISMFLDKAGDTENALTQLLTKDEKNIAARQLALANALKNKDQSALLKHLNAILKDDPASFEITVLRAEKELKTPADRKLLTDSLEQLAKQHPKQARIFLTQSLLAVKDNNLNLALEKIAQTLVLQPQWQKALNFQADLMMYAGKLAFKNKQYDKALEWFEQIKQPDVIYDAALASISVLIEQKKFPDAQQRLDKLMQQDQLEPKQQQDLLILQAEIYSLQKDYQPAIDILTKALKNDPDNREMLYTRALTAEKMDNMPLVESDLQKILAKDPDDVGALNAMGYSLAIKTNRYEEAEKYLQRAIQLQPEDAMILDSYGWLQYKKGNLEQALHYLQKAYEKMPEHEITAHLAEVLWFSGKQEQARALVSEGLKKSPEDEYLLDVKKRLFPE